jgi:D-lactate dehydrogenase
LKGFGCEILATDLKEDIELIENYTVKYCSLIYPLQKSDIIFLSLSLTSATRGLMDRKRFAPIKNNVILINTSHGAIINTLEVLDALEHN